jgi:hypothetical protein
LVWKRKNISKETRKAQARERQRLWRRKQGMRTREEFVANSYRHTKPWLWFNVCERYWYKLGRPLPPGSTAKSTSNDKATSSTTKPDRGSIGEIKRGAWQKRLAW